MKPDGYYVGWYAQHSVCGIGLLPVIEYQDGTVTLYGPCMCGITIITPQIMHEFLLMDPVQPAWEDTAG